MGADVRVVGRPNVVAAVAGGGVEEGAAGGAEGGAKGGAEGGVEEGEGHLGTATMKEEIQTASWRNFTNVEPRKLTWTIYTEDLIE